MCQIICNDQCRYYIRCCAKGSPIKPITRYYRLCKEYTEDIFGRCMKYNPILAEARPLAISIYQLQTGTLGLSQTEAIASKDGAVMKYYEIFKDLINYAMSYEVEDKLEEKG